MTENAETTEVMQPIIIDLGKQSRKKIKKMKRGKGALWDEVLDVVEEVKYQMGEEAEGKTLVPLIMVYRRKDKRSRMNPLMPLLPR